MAGNPDSRAYDEGVAAGKVYQELHEHADHLKRINGSTEKVAERLAAIEMLIRQIIDLADHRAATSAAAQDARDATVITVAAALEKKEEARRDTSSQKWTPWQRGLALLGGVVAILTIIGFIALWGAR